MQNVIKCKIGLIIIMAYNILVSLPTYLGNPFIKLQHIQYKIGLKVGDFVYDHFYLYFSGYCVNKRHCTQEISSRAGGIGKTMTMKRMGRGRFLKFMMEHVRDGNTLIGHRKLPENEHLTSHVKSDLWRLHPEPESRRCVTPNSGDQFID